MTHNANTKSRKPGAFKLVALAAATALVAAAGWAAWEVFAPSVRALDPEKSETAVYVPTGTTPEELAGVLRPSLRHTFLLEAMCRYAARKKGAVHSGKFILPEGTSTYRAVKTFFTQHGVEVNVRFNATASGLPAVAAAVSKQIEADSTSLMAVFTDRALLDSLGLDSLTVSSVFIPDTYRFYWDTSAREFFERMLREHRAFWNAERLDKARACGLTPLETTVLASIVQAETAKTDERPVVAGLYMNRLKKGIRLQSDPTVIYALRLTGKKQGPIRRVYLEDLKIDSPFNTYRNRGLPPAPINIPDISSIDAVLNYARHDYLYMCASTRRFGYHEFAASSAQHNRNRRLYIRWLNQQNIR